MKIRFTQNPMEADAITHNSIFHVDDILATVILTKVFGTITLYRTNEVPENIRENAVVFDIGHGKFDHHQRGGNGQRRNGIPYAAAGLIWKEFGPKLVENTCNPEYVWAFVDRVLISGVDAQDNKAIPRVNYPTQGTHLNNILFNFNPSWDSEMSAEEAFLDAAVFMEMAFDKVLKNAISSAKAQILVEEAIKSTQGNIMVLDKYLPWLDHIFHSSHPNATKIEFVVFPSLRGGFNFQCVPLPRTKQVKKPVPSSWKGLKDEAFQKVSGVATATFCHQEGFIGGAETLEDTIQLCKLASNA